MVTTENLLPEFAVEGCLDDLESLRITVYCEYPYLYDGLGETSPKRQVAVGSGFQVDKMKCGCKFLRMARKPRIHHLGGLYHVMLRGNGGQPVFLTGDDRYCFYLLLQEGTKRFDFRVHAFCLMTNHIHLALQSY